MDHYLYVKMNVRMDLVLVLDGSCEDRNQLQGISKLVIVGLEDLKVLFVFDWLREVQKAHII